MNETEEKIQAAGARAREIFDSKKHNCAVAVFLALNETFKGGLNATIAANIATGLGGGLGATGGTCGALTGGALALGLLADCDPATLRKKTIYPLTANLQKQFQKEFKSCNCRDLIRGLGKKRHEYCSDLTAKAAALCAELLLEHNSKQNT
jgi:C_GCAxxG_C_C family probable redox protein